MVCLAGNRWPGNVRELSNLLERLAILFPEHTVAAADLPDRYRGPAVGWAGGVHLTALPPALEEPELHEATHADLLGRADEHAFDEPLDPEETTLPRGGIDLKDHLSTIEIGLIRKALEDSHGTVAGAARLLNIRRTTLVEKLRKYRLSA
jgi:sigma-54 specific flagellar transcriptional regulator A